jgi:hypothetical protein
MILLNNVSMGTCLPESPESSPPTSFFFKALDYGDHIVEVRHIDTRPDRILTINTFRSVVSLEQKRSPLTEAGSNPVIIA